MPTYSEIFEEATRTAAPDPSTAADMQSLGASKVRATWRITSAAAGSTDQTGDMHAEQSDNGNDWEDVPGGVFLQANNAMTFPMLQVITIKPSRRYLRWFPAHAGTTLSATWGLEVAYIG